MSYPRRPRSRNGERNEGDPVRSYRLDHGNYSILERKALAEPSPRTMSDITRALIEGFIDREIELPVRYRLPRQAPGTEGHPVRSFRLAEAEWRMLGERCAAEGMTRSMAILSLLVMWQRGEVTVQWLGDRVEVNA